MLCGKCYMKRRSYGENVAHYNGVIDSYDAESWYSYKAPLSFYDIPILKYTSRGKMKEVSKGKYRLLCFEMVELMFWDRNREMKKLEELYTEGKFEFGVFYGRRRVGHQNI